MGWWATIKAGLGLFFDWIIKPITTVAEKYFEYKRDKIVVQAGVLTGAIKATSENAATIARVQMRELRDPWFRAMKLAFMFLTLIYFGAHTLQAIYFHDWGVKTVPPSLSNWHGYIMAYLFIAGPLTLAELAWAWFFKKQK
jgi:hypothetical protein